MKIWVISDNHDTITGMRLAGIEGVIVHEKEQVIDEIKKAEEDKEIGIILITEELASLAGDYLSERKLNSKETLFLEIPDRHGSGRSENAINEYIRDAIGISF